MDYKLHFEFTLSDRLDEEYYNDFMRLAIRDADYIKAVHDKYPRYSILPVVAEKNNSYHLAIAIFGDDPQSVSNLLRWFAVHKYIVRGKDFNFV